MSVFEDAIPTFLSQPTKNEANILAELMTSLIEQKCPDYVSGYAIMDAIRPFLGE